MVHHIGASFIPLAPIFFKSQSARRCASFSAGIRLRVMKAAVISRHEKCPLPFSLFSGKHDKLSVPHEKTNPSLGSDRSAE